MQDTEFYKNIRKQVCGDVLCTCFFERRKRALTNFTKKYIIASIGYDMHMINISDGFKQKSAAQIGMKVLYDGRKIHKSVKK